jgi:hypothetical protein
VRLGEALKERGSEDIQDERARHGAASATQGDAQPHHGFEWQNGTAILGSQIHRRHEERSYAAVCRLPKAVERVGASQRIRREDARISSVPHHADDGRSRWNDDADSAVRLALPQERNEFARKVRAMSRRIVEEEVPQPAQVREKKEI